MRLEFRDHDRRRPLEAVFQILRPPAHGIARPGRNLDVLAGAPVVACQLGVIATAIDDVGIGGIGNDETTLAAADRVPILDADTARAAGGRDRNTGIVLLVAVETERELVVGCDVIELGGRLVHL